MSMTDQQKGREHFLSLMHSDDWTTRAQRLPIVVNALANCIAHDVVTGQTPSPTQVEAYRIADAMNDRRASRNVRRYRAKTVAA